MRRTAPSLTLRSAPSLALIASLACSGCSCSTTVGFDDRDGSVGSDASVAPRTDECGNGLDDDGDGRIDDGCPCGPGETQACYGGGHATRRVGGCADGVQTCSTAASSEWGDWGDSPCEGDATPADEACDGLDHDCDGAVDEGCPCAGGESRPCGAAEFTTAPCRAGTQLCSAEGTWGGCEGAVVPSADVCGDGEDSDCDGEIDEACECRPAPELCRDGVDNDCDGAVDEAACEPDWPPADAGVPADGSPPGCLPETCNGADDDCDGLTDEGCDTSCRCAVGSFTSLGDLYLDDRVVPDPSGPMGMSLLRYDWHDAVVRPGGTVTLSGGHYDTDPRSMPPTTDLFLRDVTPAGAPVRGPLTAEGNTYRLQWVGAAFLVENGAAPWAVRSWSVMDADGRLVRTFDVDEIATASARPLPAGGDPSVHAVGANGGELVFDVAHYLDARGRPRALWIECHEWDPTPYVVSSTSPPIYQCRDLALMDSACDGFAVRAGMPRRIGSHADTGDLFTLHDVAVVSSDRLLLAAAGVERAISGTMVTATRTGHTLLSLDGAAVAARADRTRIAALVESRGLVYFDGERALHCAISESFTGPPSVSCRKHAADATPLGAPMGVGTLPGGRAGGYSIVNGIPGVVVGRTPCSFAIATWRDAPTLDDALGHPLLATVDLLRDDVQLHDTISDADANRYWGPPTPGYPFVELLEDAGGSVRLVASRRSAVSGPAGFDVQRHRLVAQALDCAVE